MSKSTDPGHFFQTTNAIEESARKSAKAKNTHGNPIKLPSKILAICADPSDENTVYVAEAAGTVKKINLETSSISKPFTGPTAPLTSLAISPHTSTLYAGCWDKSIWTWNLHTRKPSRRLLGHADFVKTLLLVRVGGNELLLSGSADATIIVWDVESGERLHTLKGHARAVHALAVDPESLHSVGENGEGGARDEVVVFSAGSDRTIRRWKISLHHASELPESSTTGPSPIIAHETSIDSLFFDADADLWTASADKSSRCLSRSQNWTVDTTLEHPDFVRDVVVDEIGGWVVTACRDEEVRVWDRSTGTLKHIFEGHYEEVTGLALIQSKQMVVSVGIDGTVRRWSLKARDLEVAVREREEERAGVEKESVIVGEKKEGVMTEEEERELAELMGEDSE